METGKKLNRMALTVLGVLLFSFLTVGSLPANEENDSQNSAFIGVSVNELNRHEKEELGLKWGVRVLDVERKSPADQAGIEEDDIILSFEGEKVRRAFDLMEMVGEHKVGDLVGMEILRDKQKKVLKLTLAERKGKRSYRFEKFAEGDGKAPWHILEKMEKGAALGISIEEVDGDYAEYFAVKDKSAVLVRSLEKDGPAAKGGLKAGDVLLQIGDHKIEKIEDVHKILAKMKAGDKVEIAVMRHGKNQKLNLVLGERQGPPMMRFFHGEGLPFEMPGFDGPDLHMQRGVDGDEKGPMHMFFRTPQMRKEPKDVPERERILPRKTIV